MGIRKVSILFPLFIFGLTAPAWPDPIKSMNNTANPLTTMKMNENKRAVQKKAESTKKTVKSLIKSKSRSHPELPYSDYGAIIGDTKLNINFLKAVEEKKGSPLTERLHKIMSSYDFVENIWRDRSSYFLGTAEARSSNPENSHSHLGLYPTGNRYVEERRAPDTLKLLKPRKEELPREISMGFRFSFTPLSGHMFFDLKASPPPDTGTGMMIPF